MFKLMWNSPSINYEYGLDRVVMYPIRSDRTYSDGIAIDGVISITESPSNSEFRSYYVDNEKFLNRITTEEYSGTIETYTDLFDLLDPNNNYHIIDGVSIDRTKSLSYGLSYRSFTNNSYKIHIIYGLISRILDRTNSTINSTNEPIIFKLSMDSIPLMIYNLEPISSIEIDAYKVNSTDLLKLESILYGTMNPLIKARLPDPIEIFSIVSQYFTVSISRIGFSKIISN